MRNSSCSNCAFFNGCIERMYQCDRFVLEKDKNVRNHNYYQMNREKCNNNSKRYYANNREYFIAFQHTKEYRLVKSERERKRYRENERYRQQRIAYSKKYYLTHRSKNEQSI